MARSGRGTDPSRCLLVTHTGPAPNRRTARIECDDYRERDTLGAIVLTLR